MAEETKQNDSIIELTDVVEDGDEAEDVLSDDILSEDEIRRTAHRIDRHG